MWELAHFRQASLHILYFFQPCIFMLGENWSIICDITAKLHFQAGADVISDDEETGAVEIVLLVLLTCFVVENTGIFTLQ